MCQMFQIISSNSFSEAESMSAHVDRYGGSQENPGYDSDKDDEDTTSQDAMDDMESEIRFNNATVEQF